jgi:hypothetical protein
MVGNNDTKLSDAEKKRLAGPQLSNVFDAYDRLFPDFRRPGLEMCLPTTGILVS